jgi:HK97 family phage major capsid protein
MKTKELRERLQKALQDARAICEVAEKADRDFTAEERDQVSRLMKEAADLKGKLKSLEGDEALKKQIAEMGEGIEMAQKGGQTPQAVAAGKGATLGEQFINAPEFKDWLGRFPNGRIPDSAKGLMSPPVAFKTLLTGSSDTSAGAFVQTDYTGIYEPLGRRPLVLRDLISRRTTTSDTVEFVRQTAKVSQAAPTAESNVTDYAGGTAEVSGEKPEGAMSFEKVQETVKTIAVWIPATKRALSDASQLRGLIDQELRDDLEEDLEDEIVGGDGSGEHFTGILNTSGVLTQAWDTDIFTTTRKALTAVRVTGRAKPTAWLIHPNDNEAIDLLKDGQNRYYYGGPFASGQQNLWGLPRVECEAVDEGEAILGDFRKAVIWDREQATISVSDSHSDFFIRNMVAILAELRAAFGLIRPSAFCKVDLNAGS